ncbi:DUF6414 family protein [Leptospira santarosai]|uniref:DUF6414 family protein n=1 Tax=Leptospira santarosai TaxID=28183 RepID=UPI0002BEB18D|nr:hypothetical protein [Leptospira santarosai]EMO20688.1 hypothetical protein LEP1GSC168_3587 [Leptospira santarosai str. HAI134]MDI7184396.1 hypothetical protein [Leptospira santarosai]
MIKHFIYLDPQKMYSLSSQIFEGVTDYIISENHSQREDVESQKGPIGSGKMLADVIKVSERSTEKKFLHDYSYTIFEKHLLDHSLVLDYKESFYDIESLKKIIHEYSFIKVKAKATFNDVKKITELFREYNSIGKALAYASTFAEVTKLQDDHTKKMASITDKNERLRSEKEFQRKVNIEKFADAQGLQQNPKLLENLEILTRYGFSDQFEIHQEGNGVLFTSCLIREFLRESEDLLVKKYSRKTQKEITVLGVISQGFNKFLPDIEEKEDFPNMKAALVNIVEHLSNIEQSISGKQENEVAIDPIAAYIDL